MAHDRVRDEDDREARRADAQRPVDVLDVGEQPLVEQPDALGRRARDRHRGAVGAARRRAARGSGPGRRSPSRGPSSRATRGTSAPAYITVTPSSNSTLHASRPASGRAAAARSSASASPGSTTASLFTSSTQSAPRSSARRMPTLLPPAKPRFAPVPDQLDAGEVALDHRVGAVGRAVVDADRLDPLERGERARRVLAAVPVEDDRDEPHCSVRA